MTVIAVRGNTIAVDCGLWERDTLITDQAVKVFQCRHGAFAIMGQFIEDNVSRQMSSWQEIPLHLDLPDGGKVILLTHDLRVHVYEKDCPAMSWRPEYYAAGDAGPVCMGAFAMGATAEQAVEAAIKHGPWAAGKAMSMTVMADHVGFDPNTDVEEDSDIDALIVSLGSEAATTSDTADPVDWRKRRGLR